MKFWLLNIFTFFFLLVYSNINGQNSNYYNKLKKEKKSTINISTELLKNLSEENLLDKILLVGEQIRKQKEIIYITNKELKLLGEEITYESNKIENLKEGLKRQKDEYAQLIFFASLNMDVQRNMIFILSADNFNKAYKRAIYLKQLSSFRKKRANDIKETLSNIDSTITTLDSLKQQKESLVTQNTSELDSLKVISRHLNKLQKSTSNKIVEIKEKVKKQTEKKIKIEKEVQTKIVEVEKNSTIIVSGKSSKLKGNITQRFRDKKRWHLWPLKECVVLHHYGDYYHPKYANVIVKNDGIELGSKGGSKVHSIFEGVVTSVIPIPGDGVSLIINHGDFYSVYSKIEKVNVKAGDKVTRGQIVAYLPKAKKMSKLIFQLWYKKQKLNPELWLKRK